MLLAQQETKRVEITQLKKSRSRLSNTAPEGTRQARRPQAGYTKCTCPNTPQRYTILARGGEFVFIARGGEVSAEQRAAARAWSTLLSSEKASTPPTTKGPRAHERGNAAT